MNYTNFTLQYLKTQIQNYLPANGNNLTEYELHKIYASISQNSKFKIICLRMVITWLNMNYTNFTLQYLKTQIQNYLPAVGNNLTEYELY